MYNMAHAVTGYLGMLRGIRLLWEAVEEPDIRYVVNKAFTEISRAMAKSILRMDSVFCCSLLKKPLDDLLTYCDSLLVRFHNRLLNIQVPRLAQDPLRKLSPDDRLVGAARLCERHGIFPAHIAVGIAAGYYSCAVLTDAETGGKDGDDHGGTGNRARGYGGLLMQSNQGIAEGSDQAALTLGKKIRERGIDAAITEISGIRAEEPLGKTVRQIYDRLQAGTPLREILLFAAEQ